MLRKEIYIFLFKGKMISLLQHWSNRSIQLLFIQVANIDFLFIGQLVHPVGREGWGRGCG